MNEYRETIDPSAESPEPPNEYDFWYEPLARKLGLSPEDPPGREILIAETILRDQVSLRFSYEQSDPLGSDRRCSILETPAYRLING